MQRFHVLCVLMICGLLASAISSPTQAAGDKKDAPEIPAPKRGPEHKVLESLTGTFDAKVKLYTDPTKAPATSTGVLARRMILDGNFLLESYKGTFFDKPFTGLGIVGYDSVKKQYVSHWCDSMSTSMMLLHGTYDAEQKTFTNVGDDTTPTGKKMKARDVLKIVSADEQTFEMFRQPEGAAAEVKIMEITYTRAKKDEKLP